MGSSCCVSMLLALGIFQLIGGIIVACSALAYRLLDGYFGYKYHGFMAGLLAAAIGILAILGSKDRYWARLVHVALGCAFIIIAGAIVQPLWAVGIWHDRFATSHGADPSWCFDGCCAPSTCSLADRSLADLTQRAQMDQFWQNWKSWSNSDKTLPPCDSKMWLDNCHPNEGALFVAAMAMTMTGFISLSIVVTTCVAGCMACGFHGGSTRQDRVHTNPTTTTTIVMSSPWPKPYPQQQWHQPNPLNRPANPTPPSMHSTPPAVGPVVGCVVGWCFGC